MKTISTSRPAALPALTIAALLAAVAPATASHAQKKPVPKKPAQAAPKPKPAAGSRTVVLGTKQLPGDFGKFGQTYTIGRQDGSPTNFTLDRAEYTVAPFVVGDETIVPNGDEKLLVLHYTIHNPTPAEQHVDWGAVSFTAVDAKDVNHEGEHCAVREGTKDKSVAIDLKPAQKISLMAVVKVPAEKVTPKLIVARGQDAAVIRYDLRGKVGALAAPFADAADPHTARKQVPAEPNVFYPMGSVEARLDSVSFTEETIQEVSPESGGRFLVALFTLRNPTGRELSYDWGTLDPVLVDSDGDKVEFNQLMLKASKDTVASGQLLPGEEVRVRYFFPLAKKVTAKAFLIGSEATSGGRAFVFDVSGAK